MKKRKLSTKVILVVVFFALLIIVATCLSVVLRYRKDIMERYSSQGFAYARTAAAYIDGDAIKKYLETGQKDAYYDEVESFLNASQVNSDLKYYYVYVPCEDDLIYIWDANTDEGACELGDHEDYMEGGKEVSFAAFQKDPEEQVLISMDETYGYIASGGSCRCGYFHAWSKGKHCPFHSDNQHQYHHRDPAVQHRIACGSQTEAAPSDWTFKQGIPEDGREPGERRDSFY